MKKIILIACSILAGCSSPNRSLEQALKQAIAFEAEPKQIKKVFSEFAEIGQEERTSSMYHLLGSNNLSSFLLTCPLDQLSDYMIDFAFDPVKVSRKCAVNGQSLIEYQDVTNLITISVSDEISGSFDIHAKDVQIYGTCEFQACIVNDSVKIMKLEIPAKKGLDIKPFVVFDFSSEQASNDEWSSSVFFEEIPFQEL